MDLSLLFASLLCLWVVSHDVAESLEWTEATSQKTSMAACTGYPLHLQLEYTLSAGQVVQDKRWTRTLPGGAKQTIAISIEGDFAAMPAFAARVTYDGNASITLNDVTTSDTANYTVAASALNGLGTLTEIVHTVVVTVVQPQARAVVGFVLTKLPKAVYDQSTKSYHVVLKCDVETTAAFPPGTQLIWQTPSGANLTSTGSDGNGTFYLQLENPVRGGNYVCRLENSPNLVCLGPGSQGEGKLYVDEVATHVIILEAKQEALDARNKVLTNYVDLLRTQATTAVHFYASFVLPSHLGEGQTLVFVNVPNNEGGAYDPVSGKFTAPYSGRYVFTFTTTAPNHVGQDMVDGLEAYAYMMVDNAVVASTRSKYQGYFDLATTQTVRHLNAGQQVYVRSARPNMHFDSSYSSFTGFMFMLDIPDTRRQQRLEGMVPA